MQNPELMRRLAADQRASAMPTGRPPGPRRRPRRLSSVRSSVWRRRRGLRLLEPARYDTRTESVVEEAASMLRGETHVVSAGLGRPVPVAVKLAVLAHADLERLRALGYENRRGSIRRSWGTTLASLAGEIACHCGTQKVLALWQAEVMVPLELDVLAGRRRLPTDEDLVRHVYDNLGSWSA